MISVVCCYNKPSEYSQMVESLKMQDIEYELIGVRNDQNQFQSAAAALNWGASRAHGEIFVFLHQDILFRKKDSLRNMTEYLTHEEIPDTVIGVFGAPAFKLAYPDKLKSCETLDECCVAMRKSTWKRIAFNEDLCDGWHLYVVELCIRLRKYGGQVLSGDFDIMHLSTGNVDMAYMKTFKKLLVAYKEEKWIYTTCKSMPTNLMYYYCYYFVWKIKKILMGNYNFVYKVQSLFGGKK